MGALGKGEVPRAPARDLRNGGSGLLYTKSAGTYDMFVIKKKIIVDKLSTPLQHILPAV